MTNETPNGVEHQPITTLGLERSRVNMAQELLEYPCLAVSEEFFEEMLCCLPPAYFGATDAGGFYSIMQVGEVSDYNGKGQELYETYQRMNQEAVDGKLADSRMVVGQWYFFGQRPLFIKK